MHYCPHCSKPTAYSKGKCPHCGKELWAEQAGGPSPGAENAVKGEISLDESGGSLELAVDIGRERVAKGKPEPEGAQAIPREDDGSAARELEVDEKALRLQVDVEKELGEISGYGPAPDGWGGAISYLVRVRKRMRIISGEIARIEEDLAGKKKDLDGDLLIIGRKKMWEGEALEKYPMEMGSIDVAKEKLDGARQERSEEAKEMEEKEAFLDEEILKLQNDVEKLRIEEETLGKEAQQRGGEYRKAKLKMQRHEIEARNIRQLMIKREADGALPDQAQAERLEAQLREIEGQKQALEPEMKSLLASAEEVDRKLAFMRSRMSEMMGKMALAEKRKSQVLSALQRKSMEIEEKYGKVQSEHDEAIRALAKSSLVKDDLPADFAGMKDKLEGKIQALSEIEAKIAKYLAARDSWSRDAFQKAYIMIGAGFGFLILFLILLAAVF